MKIPLQRRDFIKTATAAAAASIGWHRSNARASGEAAATTQPRGIYRRKGAVGAVPDVQPFPRARHD